MSMINTIQAHVIGASRYEVEGIKGAKLIIMNEADPTNDNLFGFQTSTMSAPYEMVDRIRELNPRLPGNLELDVEIRASQGKVTMHAIAVREASVSGRSRQADAKPDAASGKTN